ncbi:Serine/arginine repetitive matrix protein 1 [Coemansia sp. RSA 1807]|nr:Serine/arginine repetitive matrix protein 1 [Coemansia sp. RSA 1807]
MAGGFFRGTNVEQDPRFGDVSEKMIGQAKFSSVFKKPVNMSKVNLEAIKPWIADKINTLLGIEDDVLFDFVVNMLEESNTPDSRTIQVNLAGFLEDKAPEFMQNLWSVLLEAQQSEGGIPESFIRNKMKELRLKREEEERAAALIRASNTRLREQSQQRRPRSGRHSRWDADNIESSSRGKPERASSSYSRSYRNSRDHDSRRDYRRRSRTRSCSKSRSKSPSKRRLS